MLLIVGTQVLKNNLKSISSALDSQTPISSHFLFKVGPDYLGILAGGASVGLCGYRKISDLQPTGVPFNTEVEFTVEGGRLEGFLSAVDSGNLNITFDEDSRLVNIVPDVYKSDFNTDSLNPKDGFNFGEDYDLAFAKGSQGSVTQAVLEEAFAFTSPFIGNNPVNPGLGLCTIENTDEGGIVKSGDGNSVAVYRRGDLDGVFTVKGEKLRNVGVFLKNCKGDLEIYEGENYYFLTDTQGSYYGFKKWSYSFPDMKNINMFQKKGTHEFKVNRAALKGAVSRLRWGLDVDQVRLHLKMTGGLLELKATAINGRVSKEEIPVSRVDDKGGFDLYLDYKYLLKGVDRFTEGDITMYVVFDKFSYVKILETVEDKGVEVTRVLILALMRAPRN